MFVYFVATTLFSFVRFLGPVYRLLVWFSVRQLQKDLASMTNTPYTLSITYDRHWPAVSLIAHTYQTRDWKPQFKFCIRCDMRGVMLDSLKFPLNLRGQGTGRYCVKWLKRFCRRFGFSFIVLGSYPESEGFWHKMDFTAMDFQEWSDYWR